MKPIANMKGAMLLAFSLTVVGQQTLYGQCKFTTPTQATINKTNKQLPKVVAVAGMAQPNASVVHAACLRTLGIPNAYRGTV
jgi:hypothetical protein